MTTLELLVKAYQGEALTEQEISKVNRDLEDFDSLNHVAIEQLEDEGYALGDSLWHISDLDSILEDRGIEMESNERLSYMNGIISNDWTTGEIFEGLKMGLD